MFILGAPKGLFCNTDRILAESIELCKYRRTIRSAVFDENATQVERIATEAIRTVDMQEFRYFAIRVQINSETFVSILNGGRSGLEKSGSIVTRKPSRSLRAVGLLCVARVADRQKVAS